MNLMFRYRDFKVCCFKSNKEVFCMVEEKYFKRYKSIFILTVYKENNPTKKEIFNDEHLQDRDRKVFNKLNEE